MSDKGTSEPVEGKVQDEGAIPEPVKPAIVDYSIMSSVRSDKDEAKVPLWLITFTDVMALMLTFFVLLYAMSVPQEEKWNKVVEALNKKFIVFESQRFKSGAQDYINIDRINPSSALDLGYLQAIVMRFFKDQNLDNVVVFQNDNRLIISMPSDLFFGDGRADLQGEGRKTIFALGGSLSRIKNRIEIVGHSDPRPIQNGGEYANNWELSLARAVSVASAFSDVGYKKPIIVRGLASGRFQEISEDISEEERYSLSRRVDIIIMEDDGIKPTGFGAN